MCTIVLIFDIFRERNLPIIDCQRERIVFLQYLHSNNSFSSFFFLPSLMMRWSKNSTTSELHILICSSRLHEKERSVRRSRGQVTSVTHLVQCPYLRTMSAESSEIPVKVEAGKLASRTNLFISCLGPSYAFDYLHLSICSFFKKQNQSHSRDCVKGRWAANDLQGFCTETFSTFT